MILVSLAKTRTQENLLNFFFGKCTNFEVMYPNDDADDNFDNPLLEGKNEFLKLKNITIAAWSGMKNSIRIFGVLDNDVKEIFYRSLNRKGIWKYSLFDNESEVFSVSDFDVGVLRISQAEFKHLIHTNIICSDDLFE
ncbi:MAG: hypothetical protein J6E42_00715 [Firmicutes bacterium]|nr:hypothetical protein [Bacillota bacterium]